MPTHQPAQRRGRRHLALLTLTSVALAPLVTLAAAPVASAAPPSNDSWEDATPVTGLPFTAEVDTTEATKDLDVPPARYSQNSVWYHLRPGRTAGVFFSARGTDYFPHALRVYHAEDPGDAPSEWEVVASDRGYRASSPAAFKRNLEQGEDYFVMIGTSADTGGGTAKITIRRPATLRTTLAQNGELDRVDGSALIRGTLRSTRPARVEMEARLRQVVNGQVVSSSADRAFATTTTASQWRLRFFARRPFKAGPARIVSNRVRLYDEGVPVGIYHLPRNTVTLR
jgi:hypothetical protein